MYRSGSTLIYNVLKKIVQDNKLDYKIKKAHEEWLQWVKDSDLSIYTYRDVRDATASMMRKRNLTVENFKSYNNHTLSSFILKLMTHDLKVKDKGNNILVLEYNNDILNLENGIINVKISDQKLIISDNGIGMSESVLKDNYWKAGSTSKNTDLAKSAGVVGTFGIGGMANFGVCTEIIIETFAYQFQMI